MHSLKVPLKSFSLKSPSLKSHALNLGSLNSFIHRFKKQVFVLLLILLPQASLVAADDESLNTTTSPESLHAFISSYAQNVKVSKNVISFEYAGISLFCVWDANADRMRLVSPIAKIEDLDNELLLTLLKANYHTVLDARYAIGNDTLFSVFIHPLSSITKDETESAIRQVANTVLTYGTTFNSGELVFGGNNQGSGSETKPGEDKGESM